MSWSQCADAKAELSLVGVGTTSGGATLAAGLPSLLTAWLKGAGRGLAALRRDLLLPGRQSWKEKKAM